MIGLLFFGAVLLWMGIAIYLAIKLPRWLKFKARWGFAIAPMMFFLPVFDEVVAWPQIYVMCRSLDGYELAEGMDEKKAAGRVVYYKQNNIPLSVIPSTIAAEKWEYRYVDSVTGEIVFHMPAIGIRHGWLRIPAGSSGGYMTAILKGCSKGLANEEKKMEEKFQRLHITKIPSP